VVRNAITADAIAALVAVVGILAASPRVGAASDASVQPVTIGVAHSSIGIERASVQVRLYDSAIVPAADQTVALRAAAGVLAAAGIDITWLACGRADWSGNPAACAAPLAHDQLVVRLVRLAGTPSTRGELSLGYSLVDTSAAEGALATVYVNRVAWLCAQAGPHAEVDCATILGYAIAHEVGHLLLGTNAHDAAGLMRAIWSRQQLQRNHPADWVFTPGESLAMSRAVQQRRLQMATNITWNQ
jgi:hypothetical protein